MWRVTGTGQRDGKVYGYEIDAPAETPVADVLMSAAMEHGRNFRAGVVDDTLDIHSLFAQYV